MTYFFFITLIMILAAVSPGPDFALVTKNSLAYNRKIGVCTALGVAFGAMTHATYCIAGLGLILTKSPVIFTVIKFLGSTYLIYLGVKAFFSHYQAKATSIHQYKHLIPCRTAIKQGYLCNILNP